MEGVGANDMVAISLRIGLIGLFVQRLRPLAVQRQLLTTVNHRLITMIETLLRLTQTGHMTINP